MFSLSAVPEGALAVHFWLVSSNMNQAEVFQICQLTHGEHLPQGTVLVEGMSHHTGTGLSAAS